MEEWRRIPGFDEYEASSIGRVRRRTGYRCRKTRIKKLQLGTDGYVSVALYKNARAHNRHVNTLVCLAFHGEPPEGCDQSRHIDGNRLNNLASNLAWTNAKGNADDRKDHGTHPVGSKNGFSKLTESDVLEIRRRVLAGEKRKDVAASFEVCTSTVDKIIIGIHWTHATAPEADAQAH